MDFICRNHECITENPEQAACRSDRLKEQDGRRVQRARNPVSRHDGGKLRWKPADRNETAGKHTKRHPSGVPFCVSFKPCEALAMAATAQQRTSQQPEAQQREGRRLGRRGGHDTGIIQSI